MEVKYPALQMFTSQTESVYQTVHIYFITYHISRFERNSVKNMGTLLTRHRLGNKAIEEIKRLVS